MEIITALTRAKRREKLINAIIYFVRNTKYCHKLKLMKLLYFLDFWHFAQTGKSVTGLKYKAWEKGPVPPKVYHEIDPENNPEDFEKAFFVERKEIKDTDKYYFKIQPKKKFNKNIFSKRELMLLEGISDLFRDLKSKDMIRSTHFKNSPWDRTKQEKGESEWIDYLLALDDEQGSHTEEDIKDRQEIENKLYDILGEL
ncbi:DUF4065 domain-containing protein [candidate division KSB1 bacterium]|nr:DUF4065 domain-containing protein [candidate division KSB1 bacterium]